ncbi:MAG: hypothetical protein RL701_7565 [Pseudomonadota bacterium]|jgi:hypothetical protein
MDTRITLANLKKQRQAQLWMPPLAFAGHDMLERVTAAIDALEARKRFAVGCCK